MSEISRLSLLAAMSPVLNPYIKVAVFQEAAMTSIVSAYAHGAPEGFAQHTG